MADINRSTFYSHYNDKYTLLEEIEDEKIAEIRLFVALSTHSKSKEQFTEKIVKDIMIHLIRHIGKNSNFYRIMFTAGEESHLEQKLFKLIYEHLEAYTTKEGTIYNIPFDYFISYVAGAGISIIQHWILDVHRISESQLIDHFYHLVSMGTAKLITTNQHSSSDPP